MSNRDCGNCEFWGREVDRIGEKWYADCGSKMANENVVGCLETTCEFGCLCWQKKEWTLKERLVKHIKWGRGHPMSAGSAATQADTIIEIVNSYMAGD